MNFTSEIKMYHENSHILKNHVDIYEYIHGGHGVVTLQAPGGKHFTYCFKKPHRESNFREGTLFAYCIEGKNEYNYVGMYDVKSFRKTANSEYDEDSEQFKGAQYIIYMSLKDFNTPMKLYHEGVCCLCGKKLTNPESIERGIGPQCVKTIQVG